MHLQFFAQVMHVVLNRCSFDAQLAADLFIGQPAIEQLRDLQLARRQRYSIDVSTPDRGVIIANAAGDATAAEVATAIADAVAIDGAGAAADAITITVALTRANRLR